MNINQEVKFATFRDIVEAKLMEQFSGFLKKMDEDSGEYDEKLKARTSDYLDLIFLTTGQNRVSKSTYYPRGLLYKDQYGTFGVGVFFRSEKWEPCVHIISPRGVNWHRSVDGFSQRVWEHFPEAEIFTRHTFLTRCDKFRPQSKLDNVET
jgi:hypothetical protein